MNEVKLRQPVWENGNMVKWHYWGFKDGLFQHPVNSHESYLFTGEYDKHKQEIYDEDIVCIETTGINYRSDKITGVVRFIDGCFTVVFSKKVKDVRGGYWRDNLYVKCFVVNHAIQVIGNMVETPELFKAEE